MKLKNRLIFFFLASMLPWAGIASAQDARDPLASSMERIVGQIEALFPAAEGYVISLEGGEVLLDLKQGDPVKSGDRLKVIRYGEEIVHPVTKKKVGRKESELGEVEITQVGPKFSRARILDSKVKVLAGDGVRLPFKKISLLIAPVHSQQKVDTAQVILELEKRLKAHPRFDVPPLDLGVWMLESGLDWESLRRTENLTRLREKTEADFILFPTVRQVKDKSVLSYELASAVTGAPVKKAEVLSERIPALAETPPPRKTREQKVQTDLRRRDESVLEFVGKQEFPFEIVDFDIGNVRGGGSRDYVFIDREHVLIYKFEDNKFQQVAQVTPPQAGSRLISVDVGDINGNGRDEIFVTSRTGNRLNSFVVEADPQRKRFDVLWDNAHMYFRILRTFGGKTLLLSQEQNSNSPFREGIHILRAQKNRYVESGDLKLPRIPGILFTVYGLNQIPSNNSQKSNIPGENVILLDNDYHIRVYSLSGRLLVKSDDYYGHDPRRIEVGSNDQAAGPVNLSNEIVRFKGRILAVEYGGGRFILIPKNYRMGGDLLKDYVGINDSSLVFMEAGREGLEKFIETKKQKGYIAAFQVADLANGGKAVHVATVQEGSLTEKTISTVYTYNWPKN